jgi:hypothetical protein
MAAPSSTGPVASASGPSPLAELIEILLAEVRAVEALESLLATEERALVAADPAAVLDVVARARACADGLAALEARRRGAIGEIARAHGVEPHRLTLGRLATLVPEAAPALGAVQARLRPLLEHVLARSRRNGMLVDHVVRFVERLAVHLAEPLVPRGARTYGASGRVRPAPAPPRHMLRDA